MRSLLLLTSSLLVTISSAYALPASDLVQKRATTNSLASPTCDISGAKMPQGKRQEISCQRVMTDISLSASTPLPAPSAGLVLTHIAIGRGTQNYTCADN